jgi:hypothetical protein
LSRKYGNKFSNGNNPKINKQINKKKDTPDLLWKQILYWSGNTYYALHAGVRVTLPDFYFLRQVSSNLSKHKKLAMAALGPEQAALYGLSMNENNGIGMPC